MTFFSNALYRLSLIALILSFNSITVSPRSVELGEVDALVASSSITHFSSTPAKFLKTPITKRNNNKTHATRTLPIIGAITANVGVNICIDLSIRVFGVLSLNVFAVAKLQASISRNGISVQELATIQAYLAAQVAASARAASTKWECQRACSSDICSSQTWEQKSKTCTLVPRQLTTKSSVLAKLIAQLGPSDPQYCQLCPNRCNSSATAAPLIFKRAKTPVGYCPAGFNACPINPSSLSYGYECLNVQQELDSCGGCASTGEGVNCNKLPGFKRAGCNSGQCLAFECEKGYSLTETQTCVLIAA